MKTRQHDYRLTTVWTGAGAGPTADYRSYSRAYEVRIGDKLTLQGSADPTFLGDAALVNPEEMLVAALSACHMLSYLALAALKGVKVTAYEDEARGTMSETGGAGHFTRVVLAPRVTISADSDASLARSLHHEANRICFIAASVSFPVEHEPEIVAAAA